MLSQVADDVPHGIQGLSLLFAAGGGIDTQQTGVRMVGHIGIYGIAQPPLLPQLLEEAGGAASPQDGVEQQQGVALVIPIGQAG